MKTPDSATGEVDLSEELRTALFAENHVLWLISGGSNIPTTVTIMQGLADAPLKNLTIMLGDERYGQVGHADSNAQQLNDAGFDPGEANYITVLDNQSIEETVKSFTEKFERASHNADVVIGQFGIGTDGHIAGILPNSPAVESDELVVSYRGGGFTRITLTIRALKRLTSVYVFAWGESKREPLNELKDKDLSLSEQPSQILKQIPNVYIYNDQVGDNE